MTDTTPEQRRDRTERDERVKQTVSEVRATLAVLRAVTSDLNQLVEVLVEDFGDSSTADQDGTGDDRST